MNKTAVFLARRAGGLVGFLAMLVSLSMSRAEVSGFTDKARELIPRHHGNTLTPAVLSSRGVPLAWIAKCLVHA